MRSPRKILVVGAGLGGMAAAIRLAAAGHDVEIWERNDGPGGKLRVLEQDGFSWGTGPSLLTLPQVVRDLFAAAGERLEAHLELVRLESGCRYFWSDGTVIDEDAAFWSRPELAAFLDYARGIYQLSGDAFLNHPPAEMWRALAPRNWPALRHLGKVATTRTLAAEVERRIRDPHARQILLRFATYNGSSPYLTPATFNLIAYVQAEFGSWYVRGGLPRLTGELAALAERKGVRFRFGTTVTGWADNVASSQDGSREKFDFLICNADALTARTSFLSLGATAHEQRRLVGHPLSTSGFILFLGVRGHDPRLEHHNIFFSDDYREEFNEIHEQRLRPHDPTIYISISARHDPSLAPPDHDNYFVLVNVPARDPAQPWTEPEVTAYREVILNRLERFGLGNLRERIVSERAFTPTDFARRDLAHHGALYGWASHSIRASLVRPAMRPSGARNVFFVGGTTHPGGGIPLVLLSGKMVAETIMRETRT